MKRCIFAIMAAMLLCGCSIKEEPDTLAVSFFDVGKADSFLMTCGGKNLLMDAGTAKDGKKVAKRLEDMGVESIDYLMITHFDRDHAGGAAQIIQESIAAAGIYEGERRICGMHGSGGRSGC